MHARLDAPVRERGLLGISGDEQDPERRTKHARGGGELPAVHAGVQLDIADQQVDALRRARELEPRGAIRRGDCGVAELLQHLRDQRVDALLAREAEQPMRERRGALGGPERGTELAVEIVGAALRRANPHQLARDAHEQIVEIMREPAGELADRFHLLRLAQLVLGAAQCLGALLLGLHVAADRMDEALVGHRGPGEPARDAVLAAIAVLEAQRRRAGCEPAEFRARPPDILGVDEAEEIRAEQFLLGPAEQGASGRVDGLYPPREIRPAA